MLYIYIYYIDVHILFVFLSCINYPSANLASWKSSNETSDFPARRVDSGAPWGIGGRLTDFRTVTVVRMNHFRLSLGNSKHCS